MESADWRAFEASAESGRRHDPKLADTTFQSVQVVHEFSERFSRPVKLA